MLNIRNRKHRVAFIRNYCKGINTTTATASHALLELRHGLTHLAGISEEYPTLVLDMVEQLGCLERFHAPRMVPKHLTNSVLWTGTACSKQSEDYKQYIQVVEVPNSMLQHGEDEEVVKGQTVMVGSDGGKRLHVEWDVDSEEKYIHAVTNVELEVDDFLEVGVEPPNFLMAMSAGATSSDNYTIQTGDLFQGVDDSFKWYDADATLQWYRFLVYQLDGKKFVCAVNDKHLLDALSGFDEHSITISEKVPTNGVVEDGCINLVGSIRIDGTFEGKRRSAVLITARIQEDQLKEIVHANT